MCNFLSLLPVYTNWYLLLLQCSAQSKEQLPGLALELGRQLLGVLLSCSIKMVKWLQIETSSAIGHLSTLGSHIAQIYVLMNWRSWLKLLIKLVGLLMAALSLSSVLILHFGCFFVTYICHVLPVAVYDILFRRANCLSCFGLKGHHASFNKLYRISWSLSTSVQLCWSYYWSFWNAEKKAGLQVLPVFISIDPERDTVEQIREYLKGEFQVWTSFSLSHMSL